MEPVTHLLTGAVLARAGFNRKTALATAVMALAAESADLDIVGYFHGSAVGFACHRGITHTIWAIPFVAAFSVLLVYLWMKLWDLLRPPMGTLRDAPPRRWGLLYLFACISASTHLILDFTNNYGVRPFYPLDHHWYAWDIVYIVEPVMLVLLLAALILPLLFGLINSEVGVRQRGPRGRGFAIVALLAIVALWGFRDYQHRRAVSMLNAMSCQGQPPLRVAAFPSRTNPFVWQGVMEGQGFYQILQIDTQATRPDRNAQIVTYYKPEETPETQAARASYLGKAYLDWARFPLLSTELHQPPETGSTVCFRDMRFQPIVARGRKFTPLEACVELDAQRHVTQQGFAHGGRGD